MQRFGPTATDIATLKRSLVSRGFRVVGEDAHGLRVQGSASAVAQAFAVSVHARYAKYPYELHGKRQDAVTERDRGAERARGRPRGVA